MKILIPIFICIFSITACDQNSESNIDTLFVGHWKFDEMINDTIRVNIDVKYFDNGVASGYSRYYNRNENVFSFYFSEKWEISDSTVYYEIFKCDMEELIGDKSTLKIISATRDTIKVKSPVSGLYGKFIRIK